MPFSETDRLLPSADDALRAPMMTSWIAAMNITLSIEDELVAKARELARRQGTSLDEMIRAYLRACVAELSGDELADELRRSWSEEPGRSGGCRYRREDAHDGRAGR